MESKHGVWSHPQDSSTLNLQIRNSVLSVEGINCHVVYPYLVRHNIHMY